MIDLNSELGYKAWILEFIKALTTKIYEEPALVNLLFSESRTADKKGIYYPIQILLLLLIKEDINEEEKIKITVRELILMHLKLNNTQILKFIVEESEICEILIIKLG